MKIILGISAYFHDSSAAIIIGGEIIAAAQEERFLRIKNTSAFPSSAIQYCLKKANISIHQVDAIVFFEKPLLKFERLIETYYNNVPRGLFSFLKAMPQWTQKKLAFRKEIKNELKKIDPTYKKPSRLFFSSHHLSHAASAFYPSPYEKAAILVIDAVGEWSTATIGKGNGNEIELIKEMNFPNSVGLLYSSFTYYLGFEVNSGEYKLMGLSPYGIEQSEETKRFIEIIKSSIVKIFEDGSIRLNRKYFSFEYGLRMVPEKKWLSLFDIKKRDPNEPIKRSHCNLAFAIQKITEEVIIKMARTAKKLTKSDSLCLAGGVALNSVANGILHEKGIFKNIWIQPATGDAGGAIGAALAYFHVHHKKESKVKTRENELGQVFLGPQISRQDIEDFTEDKILNPIIFSDPKERDQYAAENLIEGKVIGWVQGRMEFGPRALGARSIIASPSRPEMQSKLNLSIKFREDFRPFAPVMLREEAIKYYDCSYSSPYMQFVKKLLPEHRTKLSVNYHNLPINEKLSTPRSKFQTITHVDFSSRLQIIENEDHPFYSLLMAMRKNTGDAILVNTSFNRNGEPIVCDMKDAYNCFIQTNMDILIVDNYAFIK